MGENYSIFAGNAWGIYIHVLCLKYRAKNSFNQYSSTAGVNLSFSQSEYTVSESDSTFLIQLNKNKPLANPLEVGVAALTLEEADLLGYLPLNNSLIQAGIVRLILHLCMRMSGR